MSARKLASAVFALLVVAVLVVTVFLGVLYLRARAEEEARTSALAAAREYVQKMYAWTPENISDNVNFMMGVLVGPAKKDYESKIVDNRIAEVIKQQKVVSQVTDQGSGVIENTADTAKVLLFINQSASRADTDEVQANPARVVYSMERRGGKWLINDAQLITDETLKDLVDKRDGTDQEPRTSIPVAPPASSDVPAPGSPASSEPAPETPAPSEPLPVPTG